MKSRGPTSPALLEIRAGLETKRPGQRHAPRWRIQSGSVEVRVPVRVAGRRDGRAGSDQADVLLHRQRRLAVEDVVETRGHVQLARPDPEGLPHGKVEIRPGRRPAGAGRL